MIHISIVMPAYGRVALLRRAIRSVVRQSHRNFELIVVDDFSSENLVSIVNEFNDSRIKYFRLNERSGGGGARNFGIKESSYNLVAFIDSDDEWEVEYLELAIKFLSHVKDTNFLSFSESLVWKNGRGTLKKCREVGKDENILDYILDGNLVQTSSVIVPSVVAKSILFDGHLKKHQDLDFYIRMQINKAVFIRRPTGGSIWHIDHENFSISRNNNYVASYNWLCANKNFLTEHTLASFAVKFILPSVFCALDYKFFWRVVKDLKINKAIFFLKIFYAAIKLTVKKYVQ